MPILIPFRSPPPFYVWRSHPSQKSQVLITAGVDGDELAGIEAAQKLIQQYQKSPPPIPLTIIPIVNLAGYQKKVSQNPLDGRLPKTIFPGSRFGTSSAQLMWQVSLYAKEVKLWLDLHGGNKKEHLPRPFVWADRTNTPIDLLTTHLLSSLKAPTLYTTKTLAPSLPLSRQSTSYIIFEAGELGRACPKTTQTHLRWVKKTINAYLHHLSPTNFTPTYTNISHHLGKAPPKNPHVLWWSPTHYAIAN